MFYIFKRVNGKYIVYASCSSIDRAFEIRDELSDEGCLISTSSIASNSKQRGWEVDPSFYPSYLKLISDLSSVIQHKRIMGA